MRNPESISARRRTLLGDRPGAFAEAKYLRMSATKVRRVIDLVRGLDVNQALAILRFAPQAAAVPAYKALASAVANAEHQEELEAEDLFISAIFANEGVTLRRMRPRGKGSADRIFKRGAHLTVVVEPKPDVDTAAKPASRAKTSEETAEKTKAEVSTESKATKAASKPATKAPAKSADKPAAKTAAKAGAAKPAAKAATTKAAAAKPAAKAPAKTAAAKPAAKVAAKPAAKAAPAAPTKSKSTTDQKKEA